MEYFHPAPDRRLRKGTNLRSTWLPRKSHFHRPPRTHIQYVKPSRNTFFHTFIKRTFEPLLALIGEPMNTTRQLFATVMLALAFRGSVLASSAGTTSADFLKLGVGPRAIAMGDAQTSLADDVYATYWN